MKAFLILLSMFISSLSFAQDNCLIEIYSVDTTFGLTARSSCTDGKKIDFKSEAYNISNFKIDLNDYMAKLGYSPSFTTSYKDFYGKIISHLLFEKKSLTENLKDLGNINDKKDASETCKTKPSCNVEVYHSMNDGIEFGLMARSGCSDGKKIEYKNDTHNLVEYNSGLVQHMSSLGLKPTGLSSFEDSYGKTIFEFTFN